METNQDTQANANKNYSISKKGIAAIFGVGDFLFGVIIALLIGFVAPIFLFTIGMSSNFLISITRPFISDEMLFFLAGPLLTILLILFLLWRNKKSIALGLVCGAIIPLIFTGSCLFNK